MKPALDHKQVLSDWIDLYSDCLLRIAYTYDRDCSVAEDHVQEAFIKAYVAITKGSSVENPLAWLAQIVINVCKDARRKGRREIVSAVIPESMGMNAEDMYMSQAEEERLHEAVLALPEKYRTPIVLFHFEGFSLRQLSDVLQTNVGTIKTRLLRGRNLLKRMLRGDECDARGRQVP